MAAIIIQQRAFNNKKISFVWNCVIDEIRGEKRVEGIRIRNVHTSMLSTISCDAVFVAIGHRPNTDFFRGKRGTPVVTAAISIGAYPQGPARGYS